MPTRAAIALTTLELLLPAVGLPGPAAAATLAVDVDGVEPGGTVLVAICRGGLGEAFCREGRDAPGTGRALRFSFPDLEPGTIAVAAFQDLNGNGRLDRTPLGIPLEPFCFSNGAGRDGRPDFARARFLLSEPSAIVRVRLVRALRRQP